MNNVISRAVLAATLLGLASTADAASYKTVEVTDGGSIIGSVSAGENQSETKTYTISKDTDICGDGTRDVQFVKVNNGMLQEAVVFLNKVKSGKAFPEGLDKFSIRQEKCAFSPFLGVMSNNGELTAENADSTLHNIHIYEQINKARKTAMNVSQPSAGDIVTKTMKLRKGDGMKVECDAHDFMHAFVFVAKNPYFSVVDENGTFAIGDIPAGTYQVKVWHGQLGEIDGGKIEVSANGEVTLDLSF